MDPDELMREVAEKMGQSPALFGQTMAGMMMSARDAEALEAALHAAPDDLDARAKLLAFYGNASVSTGAVAPAALNHIRWLIENAPGSELAGSLYAQAPGSDAELQTLWRYAADDHPDDVQVQTNAARFFAMHNQEALSRLYWERARALDDSLPDAPTPVLPELPSTAMPDVTVPPRQDRPEFKFYELTEEVQEAIRGPVPSALQEKATRLLSTAELFPANWNQGNALFYGHTALGLLALEGGDTAEAVRQLLLSAATPGSPQLDAFGPNLILAERLLGAGERAAVLTFFDRAAVWWRMGRGKLDLWRKQLHAGELPELSAQRY